MTPTLITFRDVKTVRGKTWDPAEIPDWMILTEDKFGHREFAFTLAQGRFYRADGTQIRARRFALLIDGGAA